MVGKGITFDTGGASLNQQMYEMKGDMIGSAVVLLLREMGMMKMKKNVVALLPLSPCERSNKTRGCGNSRENRNKKYRC